MKIPCPSCADGNEWDWNGPTGRVCPACRGDGFLGWDDPEYCECDLQPTEDELASDTCAACGKRLAHYI
jgi:hypothetical protein